MAAKVLILLLLVAAVAGRVVNVTTSKSLEEYLCPPTRTIPPNTDVIISVPKIQLPISNGSRFCLIENTTNITISASDELMNSEHGYANVSCYMSGIGFGFFNVTNLTVRSVYFEGYCYNYVPPEAIRYLNESDQVLYYYKDPWTLVQVSLMFNHCCDLTLSHVLIDTIHFSIVGANLCGNSSVQLSDSESLLNGTPKTMLFYFTDTPISQQFPKYELHVQSNMGGFVECTEDNIQNYFATKPDRINISTACGISLFLAQQHFAVDVSMSINYKFSPPSDEMYAYSLPVFVVILNGITESHVVLNSGSRELCETPTTNDGLINPLSFTIVFYETANFQGTALKTFNPISVQDVGIIQSYPTYTPLFFILDLSRRLSQEVKLENLSWCHNSGYTILHAESLDSVRETGQFHLVISNISMHDNTFDIPVISLNTFVHFTHINNVTMSGVNYFAQNYGGSVINLESSSLTVTGNLTVNDGSAYEGGGIRLDSASTLFLKEPLVATFSNNSAIEGNAIYAPNNEERGRGIQISPTELYTVNNVTEIDIHLTFINNTYGSIQRSLYAPYFSFLGQQTSPNLQLHTSDFNRSQYALTTLIDTVLKPMDDLDKYNSLDNGVCIRIHNEPWKCHYIDDIADNTDVLHDPWVYSGELAIAISNMDDNLYYASASGNKCDPDLLLGEGRNYWNTTSVSTGHTKYLQFEFYFLNKRSCVFLSNRALLSVSIIQVTTFASCPVGFNITKSGRCDCITPLKEHGYQCDINKKTLASPAGYWTGFQTTCTIEKRSTIMLSTHCPPGYCHLSAHQEFTLNNSLSSIYCNDNRNGTLCGKCKDNYSSVFGSDVCQKRCSYYYLLTIPVYAIAGLILVFALFALRLTVATGTINGVIFYANIMGLVKRTLIGEHPQVYIKVMHIVISLLNLELGFPICFYSEMSPAAKVGLQFVFPVYVWSLVLILVVLSRYSTRLTNLILNSSVQVLATLFFLSFAKILRNVIDIVSFSYLQSIDNFQNETYYNYSDLMNKRVWFYDGSDYGQGIHGFYLFLAAAFLVFFLLPYGVFSLGLTCFCRPLNKMKINLMPFIDAYCGPFKDKWRFWFGLRLWVTALLYAVDGGLQGYNTNAMFLVHYYVIGALIFLQALIRPFKNFFVTLLDTFFMLNYWLVVERYLPSKVQGFMMAYTFLLSSAILVFCLIIVGHVCFLKYPNLFNTLSDKINRRRKRYRYEAVQQEDPDEDQQLFQAAEDRDRIVDTY